MFNIDAVGLKGELNRDDGVRETEMDIYIYREKDIGNTV